MERAPYWQIVADPEGYAFVSPYGLGALPNWLDVFDRDGQWLGRLRPPEDFVPFEVGEDYILGVATDELGVEYVRMYGLTR